MEPADSVISPRGRTGCKGATDLKKPIAFFDRDGTLIEDLHFDFDVGKIRWCEGAISTLVMLQDAGWKCGVVTNQSGVARGYITEEDVHTFHEAMALELANHGVTIDFFEYCPFHQDAAVDRYRHPDHPDRKPNPGMVLRALERENGTTEGSFLVGDRESDIQAAERAGITGILFDGTEPMDVLVKRFLS